jgi:hypothetical protein
MMHQLKTIVIALAILCAFSGVTARTNISISGEKENEITDSVQSGDHPSISSIKSDRPAPGEESIYYIDIKEERSDGNSFVRLFFNRPADKNLRKSMINWGTNNLPERLKNPYMQVVEKAFRFPFIFLFVAISLVMIGNVLSVIAILFITNLFMNIRLTRKKKLRDQFEKILTDLMLQVIDSEEAIRQLSHSGIGRNKNLFIEILMDFQKSFRGDSDRQIVDLYQALDLGRISYNKTFSVSFYQQVIGIRELANMHPYHATEMIASRLNDPNEIVRTEAQICYPHVNQEFPFEFLSVLNKPFSRWAQLNIYYFIKIHEMPVPSFKKWLRSDHTNVVNFCILMIALFQQHENSDEIILMLKNPRETIRLEAIRACRELHLLESRQEMKETFPTETLKNQLEITRTFSNIGTEEDLPFLADIARSEDIPLRLEACRTLFQMSKRSRIYLDELNLSMNFALSDFIAHIKDPRN